MAFIKENQNSVLLLLDTGLVVNVKNSVKHNRLKKASQNQSNRVTLEMNFKTQTESCMQISEGAGALSPNTLHHRCF